MMDDGSQVLVAGNVEGECLADFGQRLISPALRPAVAVEIGQDAVVAVAPDTEPANASLAESQRPAARW